MATEQGSSGGRGLAGPLTEVMKLPTAEADLATFLVTVYCTIDELYVERFGPHKPVRARVAAQVSDSEVLTWMVLAHWQSDRSEDAFIG